MSELPQEQENGALWPTDLLAQANELHQKAASHRFRSCMLGGVAVLAGLYITDGFADPGEVYNTDFEGVFLVSLLSAPFLLAGGTYNALQARKNHQQAIRFEGMAMDVEKSRTLEAQLPVVQTIAAEIVQQAMRGQAAGPQASQQMPPV